MRPFFCPAGALFGVIKQLAFLYHTNSVRHIHVRDIEIAGFLNNYKTQKLTAYFRQNEESRSGEHENHAHQIFVILALRSLSARTIMHCSPSKKKKTNTSASASVLFAQKYFKTLILIHFCYNIALTIYIYISLIV